MTRETWLAAAAGLAILGSPIRADAAEALATVAWTTFARTAPSDAGQAIDEVQAGTRLPVIGCDRGWCAVRLKRAVGYVRAEILRAPRDDLAARVPGPDCFTAGMAQYHGLYPERFCHATQAKP